MSRTVDLEFMTTDSRARVYLLWAVLLVAGFVVTHYYQRKTVNGLWFVLSVIGLGYMWRVMPLKVHQMRMIMFSWLIPIIFGMTVSGLIFYIDTPISGYLIENLGAFWLIVMASGYLANGIYDPPSGWYWIAAVMNVVAAIVCVSWGPAAAGQYLIAAAVSGWSMLNLWLFRTF